jgi:disulfide oxidoreductase YuzD
MYFLARYWLVALVTRSYDAFDMMVEHIDITEKENQGDPVNRD